MVNDICRKCEHLKYMKDKIGERYFCLERGVELYNMSREHCVDYYPYFTHLSTNDLEIEIEDCLDKNFYILECLQCIGNGFTFVGNLQFNEVFKPHYTGYNPIPRIFHNKIKKQIKKNFENEICEHLAEEGENDVEIIEIIVKFEIKDKNIRNMELLRVNLL